MSSQYAGFTAPIPVGQGGQSSDFSDTSEQPQNLLLARNVSIRQGYVERAPGAVKLIAAALPAGIVEFQDFFPNDYTQRIISVLSNGKVYKTTPWFESHEITSSDGLEPTLTPLNSTSIVIGGAEQPRNPRKCFIFSGSNQVQVVSSDSNTRANIALPAIDWAGTTANPTRNFPTWGFIFAGSLVVGGCPNSPHTVFISNPNNHEDFVTNGATQVVSIYPGDGDKIVDGFVFKTRPYFTKYPRGLYYLDTSSSNYIPVKVGDSFGSSFPHSAVQALDDTYIANSVGSITSLKAVFSLGETEQGDVLKQLKNSKFASQYLAGSSLGKKKAIYFEDKKQVMIGSSSGGSGVMDRLYNLDFTASFPMFHFYDKEQMTALGLVRDVRGIPRPVYGAANGFFYGMDTPMRSTDGTSYLSEFQTHNMDFKWLFAGLQSNMEEKDKHFDYVGLTYEPCGNWTVNCDAYVDGNKKASLAFSMGRTSTPATYMDGKFPLDRSSLVGKNTVTQILPLKATGKKLRLRIYTSAVNQNFKISALTVYLRPAGINNRSG